MKASHMLQKFNYSLTQPI